MYIKRCWKYIGYLLLAVLVIILFLKLTTNSTMINETFYIPYIDLKIYDLGSLVALMVGILAFLGTVYSVDKNYQALKLTSLPDNSANLLIDLEFLFSEYNEDELVLLTEILKYWKSNQKSFRLLTPHFYKEFLKIITEEKSSKETNAYQYILKALVAQITNIAFDSDKATFSFIKPKLIEENVNLEELGNDIKNYITIEMTKKDLNTYIESIPDENTKTLAKREFKNLTKKIKSLLNDLKREIEEYD